MPKSVEGTSISTLPANGVGLGAPTSASVVEETMRNHRWKVRSINSVGRRGELCVGPELGRQAAKLSLWEA